MRLNQINISRIDYNKTLGQFKNEKNDVQGRNFSFTPSQKEIYPLSSQKLNDVEQNLNFILSHFQEPIFPRNIMTKALGYQKEAFNINEVLNILEHQTMKTAGSMHTLHLLNTMALIELGQVF